MAVELEVLVVPVGIYCRGSSDEPLRCCGTWTQLIQDAPWRDTQGE